MDAQAPGTSVSFFRRPAAPGPPSRPPAAAASAPGHAPPGPPASRQARFHGSGGTLFGLWVVNTLLTLLTLGVYYFWGKTRVRRYLFGQTDFEGDRFAYHGTGPELLLGFLRAFVVFILPITALQLVPDQPAVAPELKGLATFVASALLLVFIPVAWVGARRYRLSRTSWRGIRFSFRGRAGRFIGVFLKGTLLTGVTFGLYYPWFATERQAFMVSHTYFGNERFDFDARARELFWAYVLALVLTLPTLGLAWVWFIARRRRFFWNHTAFGGARFRSTVTGGALAGLWLVNGLLLLATLGLAWPWVRVRNVEFAFRCLALEGPLEVERIRQQALQATATGEGLASFLDTGFDLG
jgi:uncharacterized membrane protein YjgN (DUF898 family)